MAFVAQRRLGRERPSLPPPLTGAALIGSTMQLKGVGVWGPCPSALPVQVTLDEWCGLSLRVAGLPASKMSRSELAELIVSGEGSGLEFKSDRITPAQLAREMAALLNLEGGHILLGVEDDGTVTGLRRPRKDVEEWVMEVARTHIQPATIPFWEVVEWDQDTAVGIVSIPANAPDKPYKAKVGSAWSTKVRVGTTTRDATREEEERLYQQSGGLRYGLKPVMGTGIDSLDFLRLRDYFINVLEGEVPDEDDREGWEALLSNLELVTRTGHHLTATIDGMLLFGRNTRRKLPQSGIRAICYVGEEPDYATRADEVLAGPLVPLRARDGSFVELGLVDRAWDFVRRNTTPTARIEGMRRIDRWEFPEVVVREAVANALIHRDYSIFGTDITFTIFSNRLEVRSPGRLPNTITASKMKSGMRYARNQNLVHVMRDYGYVDARGMGVRNKMIPGMLVHNGTEPDLLEDESDCTVRLWKERKPS